jgi:hypothetical protein
MKKLILSLFLLFAIPAHAEFLTGNKLLQLIKSSVENERGFAFGYIAGAFDTGHGAVHCAPENVTVGQVTDMVKNLLETTPSQRHKSADQFVNAILSATWPCKKQPTNGNGGRAA